MTESTKVVEVCYARAHDIRRFSVELPNSATVETAILSCELLSLCPELKIDNLVVGIFGHKKNLQTEVRQGDRVEIYSPLRADPKEARHRRVGKQMRSKF
jgi:putative ubiquitin-RnfH superfamily antitoxin RatB of RatAB toxin-antitoxin module